MKDLHEDNMFGSIRERLGGYEETPSDALWSKIQASQKRRRGIPLWVYSGAGIGAIIAGFLLLSNDVKKEETIVDKNEIAGVREQTINEAPAAIEEKQKDIRKNGAIKKESIVLDQKKETEASPAEISMPTQDSTQVAISIPTTPTSQPTTKEDEVVPPYKKPRSKFQLYVSVTPSLSFQKIIPTNNDEIIVQGLAYRSPFSIKRFGIAVDAGLQYELNRFLGFYGGLSFYRQQQTLTYNFYDKDAMVTRIGDSWTFVIDRPSHSKTFDYTMTNLGAQGGVLVTLKGEKLKNKFGAGLNYTQSLNSSASYVAYQVFYRSEVKINEQFSWYVQPMFTYAFIAKETLNEPFTVKPYRAGISGGVLYRFKK